MACARHHFHAKACRMLIAFLTPEVPQLRSPPFNLNRTCESLGARTSICAHALEDINRADGDSRCSRSGSTKPCESPTAAEERLTEGGVALGWGTSNRRHYYGILQRLDGPCGSRRQAYSSAPCSCMAAGTRRGTHTCHTSIRRLGSNVCCSASARAFPSPPACRAPASASALRSAVRPLAYALRSAAVTADAVRAKLWTFSRNSCSTASILRAHNMQHATTYNPARARLRRSCDGERRASAGRVLGAHGTRRY